VRKTNRLRALLGIMSLLTTLTACAINSSGYIKNSVAPDTSNPGSISNITGTNPTTCGTSRLNPCRVYHQAPRITNEEQTSHPDLGDPGSEICGTSRQNPCRVHHSWQTSPAQRTAVVARP